ncbi:MAG: CPBP family intramembrane metalloprotease [Oscillospiraceae bacterium]|nr:CPBP family intramembrane metalloprotease [Oscillospiraceae bacterium]
MKDWKLSETRPQFERIRSLPNQRVSKHLIIILLLAVAYWLCDQLGMFAVLLPIVLTSRLTGNPLKLESPGFMLIMLFLTVISIILNILICKLIERRTLRTMGITKHHCLRDYLTGAAVGLAMFSAVVGMCAATGAVKAGTPGTGTNIPMIIAFFVAFMIQGFSEEFACRGFMMMSAGTCKNPWVGVIFNSLLFGAAHIGNEGATVSGVANVALFGIVMSLFMLRTDSIWGPAALHTVWNWAQGNFFGLKVSGMDMGASILHFEQTETAAWMNGGSFGLEGGLGTTIILVVVALILLFAVPQRKTEYPAITETPAEAAAGTSAEA